MYDFLIRQSIFSTQPETSSIAIKPPWAKPMPALPAGHVWWHGRHYPPTFIKPEATSLCCLHGCLRQSPMAQRASVAHRGRQDSNKILQALAVHVVNEKHPYGGMANRFGIALNIHRGSSNVPFVDIGVSIRNLSMHMTRH